MRRIYPDHAYGPAPRAGCFWDTTCDLPDYPSLDRDVSADVAIIGAGFTGLNAARALVSSGASVILLDEHAPGWGASGRNGGFCCLGGGKSSDTQLDRRFGKDARLEWRNAEKRSVAHVDNFLRETGADVDRHSEGETLLAHRPKDARAFDAEAQSIEENYGLQAVIESADASDRSGKAGGFYGALTVPIGFALNPRKYVAALLQALAGTDTRLFSKAPVTGLHRHGSGWRLKSGTVEISAKNVIVATNGYSSEDIPKWLAGRYMPVQSSVAVTRPISPEEQEAQGWNSHQMCYDTRNLLHYFRLMPNGRMLFGLRGGIKGTPGSDARAYARLRADFDAMFAQWRRVEFSHNWTGFVCLARKSQPFIGEIPNMPGVYCAMGYHGNGVAMGSYAGDLVGRLVAGDASVRIHMAAQSPLATFPYGRIRRVLLAPAYAMMKVADR